MRSFILSFALGVWLLQQQARLWEWPGLLALAAMGLALLAWRPQRGKRGARVAMVAVSAVCIGFAWASVRAHIALADRLASSLEGRDIVVTGVIASLPQSFERGVRFDFDVEHTDPGTARFPRRIGLAWYTGPSTEEFQSVQPVHAGERWRFTVRLKRPHGSANPHGFDYELWLLERGVGASGYVRPRTARQRLDAFVYRPGYVVERWREAIRAKLQRSLGDAPHAGVLVALAVGDQRAIDGDAWQIYTRTGVSHLMSISGLHVTMIAGLFAWMIYSVWRRVPVWTLALPARKAAAMAAMAAALGYCLLAGFAVPAQRTLYMIGAVAIALYFDRAQSSSRVLSWALLSVLLFDPWAIMAPGFWLSFAAVALMMYVGVFDHATHWLKRWAGVQWAITVGLAPLLLVLFQQVSIVSPLANAIAIPVVSFIVTPLALSAAVLPGDWLPQAAHWVLEQLMRLLEILAYLPGAVWQQHAPEAWTAILAMAGIAWMLAPRGWPARYCGVFFLLPLFALRPATPQDGSAWIEVLDVGQGLAVVVRTARHTMLYDTGPAYSADADAGNRVVLPYLRAIGVAELDALMLTHEDKDHSGGALSVLEAMPTDLLWSSLPMDHAIVQAASSRVPCRAGSGWEWDGVRFDILYPPMASYAAKVKSNSRSCVLKVSSAKHAALLTGDIEAPDEAVLLAAQADLRADVLFMPHHGSNTSSTASFIQAVSPEHAVAAAGYRNRFGHPRAEVLARYEGAQIWRTDLQGAVAIQLEDTLRVTAYRETAPRYWRD